MALRGKGLLAVFTDVRSRDRVDYIEWYIREHIDERIGVAGIHRGRFYAANEEASGFLAIYECAQADVLATPAYLRFLTRQSAWTRRSLKRVTDFDRLVLRVVIDKAHGFSGALSCVKFAPDPRQRGALLGWLREQMARASRTPGLLGAAAAVSDPDITNAPGRIHAGHRPTSEAREWLLLFEATEPAIASAAAGRVARSLRKFGVAAVPPIRTYRLLSGNDR